MVSLKDFGISFNIGAVVDQLLFWSIIVITIIVISGIAFFLLNRRKKLKNPDKKLGWWEEVNENLIPTAMDTIKEIIIPGTRLKVFYIKAKDMWLPRFTRGITKDLFYVCITPKREMVNFTLTKIGEDMEKAGLKYDHTDMIWASENLREFIKRNYRDKATPWWKAYQGVITTAIYIIILTFSFVVILYFMREMMGDIGGLLTGIKDLMKEMESCYPKSSGLSSALIPLMFIKSKGGKK